MMLFLLPGMSKNGQRNTFKSSLAFNKTAECKASFLCIYPVQSGMGYIGKLGIWTCLKGVESGKPQLVVGKVFFFSPNKDHSPFSIKLLRSPPVSYCSFRSNWKEKCFYKLGGKFMILFHLIFMASLWFLSF